MITSSDVSTYLRHGRPILCATDLRGRVVGLAGPRVGVALFEVKPNKKFSLVRQTVTAPDGKYYFNKIHPGRYVLRIGGINYPLEVGETQVQDIPVIAPPRQPVTIRSLSGKTSREN